MNGYDIDGVLTAGILPEGDWVVISGRTYAEYDIFARSLAVQAPVYIRGSGEFGDREDAGRFKAEMVRILRIEKFFEDDPLQAKVIQDMNPDCKVELVVQ